MTLIEFLAARFEEEANIAQEAIDYRDSVSYVPGHEPEIPDMGEPYVNSDVLVIGVAMGAERFLSDVESKIKILEHLRVISPRAVVLRYLAQPYSSHPDFDLTWLTS